MSPLLTSPLLFLLPIQETMKFSADQEMLSDWFTDRDIKVPHVILNDKLMSDAILGGMPIKTEHSYSLNSDGDSMAYSPDSLHKQIDGKSPQLVPLALRVLLIKHGQCTVIME